MSDLRLIGGYNGREFVVNQKTGVCAENGVDGRMVWTAKRDKREDEWVQISIGACAELSKMMIVDESWPKHIQPLVLTDVAVYLQMMAFSKYENWVDVKLKAIAERLEISPERVSKSCAKLMALGLVSRAWETIEGNRRRLNPQYCWRGNAKLLREAIENQNKQLQLDFSPVSDKNG